MKDSIKSAEKCEKEKRVFTFLNPKAISIIKRYIIITKIRKTLEEAILVIQKNWRYYIMKNNIHKLAYHVSGCYTIASSLNNITKIQIKIFTNDSNSKDYTIIPLYFCKIRKAFVIDIPKNKFYGDKKILRFNFIYNGQIIIDDNYEKNHFYGQIVNEIDLSLLDKRQKELDNIIYSVYQQNNYLSKSVSFTHLKNKSHKHRKVKLSNKKSSINESLELISILKNYNKSRFMKRHLDKKRKVSFLLN